MGEAMDALKSSAFLFTVIWMIGTLGMRSATGVHEMNVFGIMNALGLVALILWISVAVRAERRRKRAAARASNDEAICSSTGRAPSQPEKREGTLNATQRLLVVGALVAIGIVLMVLMLRWGVTYWNTEVFAFYSQPDPRYPGSTQRIGVYTQHGAVTGILLGVVVPLCLFAAAAFVHLGGRKKT